MEDIPILKKAHRDSQYFKLLFDFGVKVSVNSNLELELYVTLETP